MTLPIVDVKTLEAWGPAQDTRDSALMQRLVLSASEYLERETGRVFKAADTPQSFVLNGDDAIGKYRDSLALDLVPLVSVASVSEDGSALTVGTGYSTTVSVLALLNEGLLLRNARTSWNEGRQNVVVSATPGYAAIPADVTQACIELSRLLYKESRRQGVESMTRGGVSSNFVRDNAPFVQRVIDHYRDWRRAL